MFSDATLETFQVRPGKKAKLKDRDPSWDGTDEIKGLHENDRKEVLKKQAQEFLEQNLKHLADAQNLLYADARYALLIVLQGMDASGKDGTIRHVMSGVNPQGCEVHSFKKPSPDELAHDFLWRCVLRLPPRGKIGIFNRSYYEEVIVAKLHPELLDAQRLPPGKHGRKFWDRRYESINAFEKHLVDNGTVVLKFFLHLSKDEQKKQLLERIDTPEKRWKFAPGDIDERQLWDDYIDAYDDALTATSTDHAPWYIVPADHKWVARALVADVITTTLRTLDLQTPEVDDDRLQALQDSRRRLLAEK